MLPTAIYHADRSVAANKRWLAQATPGADGRYIARAPSRVGDPSCLISSIRNQIRDGNALVGLDFPIGIPAAYARLAGVTEFKTFLRELGNGAWAEFYSVATVASEILVRCPFYPFSPGGKKQAHLLNALAVQSIDDLRRECEREQPRRRSACSLFWTLGPNQVGKAAIVGWRDVLAPALNNREDVSLWPFDGDLVGLLKPGKIVIAETYPGECYCWFLPERLRGKGKQEVRRAVGPHLTTWAASLDLALEPALLGEIETGFPEGDDAFDAVVGLFGMIEVVSEGRPSGEPDNDKIRKLEGWILGQVGETGEDSLMHISPRYTVSDWKALNLNKKSDWQKAIRILHDRLNSRFFEVVEAIKEQEFSGFAVLALDCLLVETLQQFKEGVDETPRRKGEEYFVRFLMTPPFSAYFNRDSASKFYDHFRCGILHQAEIKGTSKVWRVGPLVAPTSDGHGLIVNRKLFHSVLRKAFSAYMRILRTRSDAGLCESFVKKWVTFAHSAFQPPVRRRRT